MTTINLTSVAFDGVEVFDGVGPEHARPRRARNLLIRIGRLVAIFAPVLVVSSFITYAMGALANNDPAATILGQDNASPAAVHKLNHVLGLDRPLLVQYWHWLSGALHGNLGTSYFTQIPVAHSIGQRLPVDLSITTLGALFAIIIGTSAGILAGLRRGSWIDRAVTAVCSVAATIPPFVLGIALVVIFSMQSRLLPGNGYVGPTSNLVLWFEHIVLPSLALSAEPAVGITRQLRTALVDVLDQNYIVGAVVRGLPRRRILIWHALRNAAGPALTVLGYAVPLLIGGAVVTETVFSLPGLGQLALGSASTRDVPVVQGVLLVTSSLVIAANLIVNALLIRLQPGSRR